MLFNETMEIQTGKPTQIGTGIYLLRMPLPFRLDHINLYLIEGDDGWTLIDTGLNKSEVKAVWQDLFDSFFTEKKIKRIILTHLHPDHIGLAHWLQNELDVPVYISAPDWQMAQNLWLLETEDGKHLQEKHFKRFGIDGQYLSDLVDQRAGYKKLVKQLPGNITFLAPGIVFKEGGQNWEVIAASGHSPQHLCLWNKQQNLLISGDHILPTITPNISVMAHGLENPLRSYLESLKEFLALPCQMYLPAHGNPSKNYHERINSIILHHEEKLMKLLEHADSGLSVEEALPLIFERELPIHQHMFALGETAAHLVYLAGIGQLDYDNEENWKFYPVSENESDSKQRIPA